jgi:hypothetical protein
LALYVLLLRRLAKELTLACIGNCTPHLPASHFKVKKEGKNRDRWFYTCQLEKEKSCGFFLWGEDAKEREGRALLGNKRSEVDSARAIKDDNDTTTDKEFGDWPVSPTTERKMGREVPGAYPETPRKAAKTTNVITPGIKRKRESEAGNEMLPTPFTGAGGGRFGDLFGSTKRGAQDSGKDNALEDDDVFGSETTTTTNMGMRSPFVTPTPVRFLPPHNTEGSPLRPANLKLQYDISNKVFSLLHEAEVQH